MTDIIDIHTHTIASMHAYSTIREMAAAAKEKGLALLGISDHAPALPGTFHELYFHNFKVIRPAAYGIDLIMGAELNVLDHTGTVDLPEKALKKLHYVIASLHDLVIAPGSQEENTAALLGGMWSLLRLLDRINGVPRVSSRHRHGFSTRFLRPHRPAHRRIRRSRYPRAGMRNAW